MFIEGPSFDQLEDDIKRNFKKSILSLHNIDDRFKFDWNNIRYIDPNEKNIREYLMLKGKLSKGNNMMTLNFNSNGVSVIGSENPPQNSNSNSNNLVNSFNKNSDSSKTVVQVNNKDSTENVYSKNFNYNLNNVENNFYNLLKNQPSFRSVPYNCKGINCQNDGICYMGKCICKDNFYGMTCEKTLIKNKKYMKKKETFSGTINFEKKYQKIIQSDPSFQRLEDYISDQLREENIHISSKQLRDFEIINNMKNFRFSDKENSKIIQNKALNNSILSNKTALIEANTTLNPCFNKGFYDIDLKINGLGSFDKCHKFLLDFFFNNKTNETNSISKYQNSHVEYINKSKVIKQFRLVNIRTRF